MTIRSIVLILLISLGCTACGGSTIRPTRKVVCRVIDGAMWVLETSDAALSCEDTTAICRVIDGAQWVLATTQLALSCDSIQ